MKKNSCTPINPKKYSCYGLKKIHKRNLITKKNSCGSKIPSPPPHNFSNGPSLRWLKIKPFSASYNGYGERHFLNFLECSWSSLVSLCNSNRWLAVIFSNLTEKVVGGCTLWLALSKQIKFFFLWQQHYSHPTPTPYPSPISPYWNCGSILCLVFLRSSRCFVLLTRVHLKKIEKRIEKKSKHFEGETRLNRQYIVTVYQFHNKKP